MSHRSAPDRGGLRCPTVPHLPSFSSTAVQDRHSVRLTLLSDYWALTKPEVNFLILITTLVGFYLGSDRDGLFSYTGLFNTLLGTLLVASGTGSLNQYVEREFDAQMRRTARRPAAAGRIKPSAALLFGIALAAAGGYVSRLCRQSAHRQRPHAVLTLFTYLFVYTPLKRETPLCVLVGAFPGAMPPLIGWAAAGGRLTVGAAGILLCTCSSSGSSLISSPLHGCTGRTTTARWLLRSAQG